MPSVFVMRSEVDPVNIIASGSGGGSTTGGSTFNITLPSAPLDGDVLIAGINVSQYSHNTGPFVAPDGGADWHHTNRDAVAPAGWTQRGVTTLGNVRLYVFAHTCGPGESATSAWGVTGSTENHAGVILHLRNAQLADLQIALDDAVVPAQPNGLAVTVQAQDYGSAGTSGATSISEPGWITDKVETPSYHEIFIGHRTAAANAGASYDPAITWRSGTSDLHLGPAPSQMRRANLVVYPT
jgi:hypothetical protein